MTETRGAQLFLVREVHNFGGFFGGDTVTLTAAPRERPDEEREMTIDERALSNVRDRHTIAAGMLLAIELAGERVERAELLAATSHAELRAALGPAAPPAAPLILSYRCEACGLWVASEPLEGACRSCGKML